jgi:uncharacterized protein YecE (DUF72 family)
MKKGKLYIGTSGWIYPHWQGIFYPENLAPEDRLKYFSRYFKTVEINYSFYHLPSKKVCQVWHEATPSDFLFAVKVSRFITHIKKLKGVQGFWKTFIGNILNLREKLGPLLLQFPSSFKAGPENVKRLEDFLKFIHSAPSFFSAFEFRCSSWFIPEIYRILKKYNAALVSADSDRYPCSEAVTADFIYLRMHGRKEMFNSNYSEQELGDLAERIKNRLKEGINVYCYFNNDTQGYALKNAQTLIDFLK